MSTPRNNRFKQSYLKQHMRRAYNSHLKKVEDVAAAFMSRHGIDPDDAMVVTKFDDETMTWTTRIERSRSVRRKNTEGGVPGMPQGR